MKFSVTFLKQILQNDQRGVTAVEYALVAGALVLGIATAFAALSTTLTTYFTNLTF